MFGKAEKKSKNGGQEGQELNMTNGNEMRRNNINNTKSF